MSCIHLQTSTLQKKFAACIQVTGWLRHDFPQTRHSKVLETPPSSRSMHVKEFHVLNVMKEQNTTPETDALRERIRLLGISDGFAQQRNVVRGCTLLWDSMSKSAIRNNTHYVHVQCKHFTTWILTKTICYTVLSKNTTTVSNTFYSGATTPLPFVYSNVQAGTQALLEEKQNAWNFEVFVWKLCRMNVKKVWYTSTFVLLRTTRKMDHSELQNSSRQQSY